MRAALAAACPDAVFTGTLGRQQVAEVFASADVFVFPSRTDTAGTVVLETQASGLPVIVSEAGGPREQMADGVTGRVVRGNQVEAWAAAVRDVAGSPRALQHHRAAARQHALDRRWDLALAPLYDAYRAVFLEATTAAPHGTRS